MLLEILHNIKDFRRKQGQQYQLGFTLYFAILAILSGATSYRKIHTFLKIRFITLKDTYNLNWKHCPAYTTIRNVIQGVSSNDLEEAFRKHSQKLSGNTFENDEKKKIFI